jgi:hypothetical protein
MLYEEANMVNILLYRLARDRDLSKKRCATADSTTDYPAAAQYPTVITAISTPMRSHTDVVAALARPKGAQWRTVKSSALAGLSRVQ